MSYKCSQRKKEKMELLDRTAKREIEVGCICEIAANELLRTECQYSVLLSCWTATDNHFSSLIASKAQILANRELFIQSGSDINLTCIAPQAPGPYTHMLWYKDTELVSDSTRGGIRVISEQQIKTSNLVISRVLHTDSGNYTCSADNSSECWPQTP